MSSNKRHLPTPCPAQANEEVLCFLRNNPYVGYFDESRNKAGIKELVFYATLIIDGVFRKFLVATFDVTSDTTGQALFDVVRTCLESKAIFATLIHVIGDGGSNICVITGPFSSLFARLMKVTDALGSDWCTPHLVSLVLQDMLLTLAPTHVRHISEHGGFEDVQLKKERRLQQVPLVKLFSLLSKLFHRESKYWDVVRDVLGDIPLDDAVAAVGLHGALLKLTSYKAIRWVGFFSCAERAHQVRPALTKALEEINKTKKGRI